MTRFDKETQFNEPNEASTTIGKMRDSSFATQQTNDWRNGNQPSNSADREPTEKCNIHSNKWNVRPNSSAICKSKTMQNQWTVLTKATSKGKLTPMVDAKDPTRNIAERALHALLKDDDSDTSSGKHSASSSGSYLNAVLQQAKPTKATTSNHNSQGSAVQKSMSSYLVNNTTPVTASTKQVPIKRTNVAITKTPEKAESLGPKAKAKSNTAAEREASNRGAPRPKTGRDIPSKNKDLQKTAVKSKKNESTVDQKKSNVKQHFLQYSTSSSSSSSDSSVSTAHLRNQKGTSNESPDARSVETSTSSNDSSVLESPKANFSSSRRDPDEADNLTSAEVKSWRYTELRKIVRDRGYSVGPNTRRETLLQLLKDSGGLPSIIETSANKCDLTTDQLKECVRKRGYVTKVNASRSYLFSLWTRTGGADRAEDTSVSSDDEDMSSAPSRSNIDLTAQYHETDIDDSSLSSHESDCEFMPNFASETQSPMRAKCEEQDDDMESVSFSSSSNDDTGSKRSSNIDHDGVHPRLDDSTTSPSIAEVKSTTPPPQTNIEVNGLLLHPNDISQIKPGSWLSTAAVAVACDLTTKASKATSSESTTVLDPDALGQLIRDIPPTIDDDYLRVAEPYFELEKHYSSRDMSRNQQRSSMCRFRLQLALNDGMKKGSVPSHNSYAVIDVVKEQGSMGLSVSAYHFDPSSTNAQSTPSRNYKVFRTLLQILVRLLQATHPSLSVKNNMDLGKDATIIHSMVQNDGNSCGPRSITAATIMSSVRINAPKEEIDATLSSFSRADAETYEKKMRLQSSAIRPKSSSTRDGHPKEDDQVADSKSANHHSPNATVPFNSDPPSLPQRPCQAGTFDDDFDLEGMGEEPILPEEETIQGRYFTVMLEHPDEDSDPKELFQTKLSELVETVYSLDQEANILKTSILPFSPSELSKEVDLSNFDCASWLRFCHLSNPAYSLRKINPDEAVDDQGNLRKQSPIFGTIHVESILPPEVITSESFAQLSLLGIKIFDKAVQVLQSEPTAALSGVSIKFDPSGVKDRTKQLLEKYHSGPNRYCKEDLDFGKIQVKVRPIRLSKSHQGQSVFASLPPEQQAVHKAFHIEAPAEQAAAILAYLEKPDKDGSLHRIFGRSAGFFAVGRRTSGDVTVQNEQTQQIHNQHTVNQYFGVETLRGLHDPFKRFNVALADGSAPANKKSSLKQVLMAIRGSDTAANYTASPVIMTVLRPSSGPNAGSTQVAYRDDRKGTGAIRGGKRKTNGPYVSILSQVAKCPGYFMAHFMKCILGYSDGTIASALGGVSFEYRVSWRDHSSFNPDTLELTVSPEFAVSSNSAQEGLDFLRVFAQEERDSDVDQENEGEDDNSDDDGTKWRQKQFLFDARILHPDETKRVGGDGASVRTDASGVSSVARSEQSTGTRNVKESYLAAKQKNLDQLNTIAAKDDQIQQMKKEHEKLAELEWVSGGRSGRADGGARDELSGVGPSEAKIRARLDGQPNPRRRAASRSSTIKEAKQLAEQTKKSEEAVKTAMEGWLQHGLGRIDKDKPDGTVRLSFENWNSLKVFTERNLNKVQRIETTRKEYGVDIMTGVETQANWDNVKADRKFEDLFGMGEDAQSAAAHNRHWRESKTQYGGAAMTAIGRVSGFVDGRGTDSLGRWAWMYFRSGDTKARIITAYRPKEPSKVRRRGIDFEKGGTVWEQQWRYFKGKGYDDRNPLLHYDRDLSALLKDWRRAGDEIILCIDANAPSYNGRNFKLFPSRNLNVELRPGARDYVRTSY
ncbi:hypothetical protein THAOC_17208, partial [Thalassiosira oceanica]